MKQLIKTLVVLVFAGLGCAGAARNANVPVDPTCKSGDAEQRETCLRHKLEIEGDHPISRIEAERSEMLLSATAQSSAPPPVTSPVSQPAAQPAAPPPSLLPGPVVAPQPRQSIPFLTMMQNRKVCFPDNPKNGCDDTFNIYFRIFYGARLWEVKSPAIMPSDRDAMNVKLSQNPSDPKAPGMGAGHLTFLWIEQANGVRRRALLIPPGEPAEGFFYFDSTNGGSGPQSYELVAYETSNSCGWTQEFPCKATRERVRGNVVTPFQDNWFKVTVTAQHVVSDRGYN